MGVQLLRETVKGALRDEPGAEKEASIMRLTTELADTKSELERLRIECDITKSKLVSAEAAEVNVRSELDVATASAAAATEVATTAEDSHRAKELQRSLEARDQQLAARDAEIRRLKDEILACEQRQTTDKKVDAVGTGAAGETSAPPAAPTADKNQSRPCCEIM